MVIGVYFSFYQELYVKLLSEKSCSKIHLDVLQRKPNDMDWVKMALLALDHEYSIDDIVNHGVGKCLDQFDLEHNLYPRWGTF